MIAWRSLAGLLALCACAHVTPARAADATTDVDVSRVTLKLPGDGWTVSDKLPYAAAVESSGLTVDGERRIVAVGQPGTRASLVMMVSATRCSGGVTMHADCDPMDDWYIRKFNRGQSTFVPLQCLKVYGPARFPANPADFGGDLGKLLAERKTPIPPGGYYLRVQVCNENGAIVQIMALVGNGFAGLEGRAAAVPAPKDMRQPVVAWADLLAENALGTLSSLSARLEVPPVAFTNQVVATAAAASAPAVPPATKD